MTRTLIEKLASSMLATGSRPFWELNVAAAEAYRTGTRALRHPFFEIADAAEIAWLRAEGERRIAF
jgi:hypothetical protein